MPKNPFYRKELQNGTLILETASPKYASQQAALQGIVFPTLSEEELITSEKYLNHIKVFPEGQLIVREGETVIASSTTFRTNYSSDAHTFLEITDDLWLNNSNPDGEWLYGVDVSVRPDYQGKGIGRAIYDARQEIAKQLGCKGQLTVGMPIGYVRYAQEMNIETYCKKLETGELTDPTVTAQMKFGFKWLEPFFDYLDDPRSGNAGISMYWAIDKNLVL